MVAGWLTPFSRGRSLAQQPQETNPLWAFRRDFDRLFDDFFGSAGFPGLPSLSAGGQEALSLKPQIDLSETDREIRITAELPGIDEKDIDITLSDDLLTIRAQKQAEREEQEQDYYVKERSQGTFIRSIRLPFAADPDQIRAVCRNGILNLTIPKPQEAQGRVRRIEVRKEEGAAGAERPQIDRAAAGDKPSAQTAGSPGQESSVRQSPGE